MVSGDKGELEKGLANGLNCDIFYKGLVKKVSESDMRLWFEEGTNIYEKSGEICVDAMDVYCASWLKDNYGAAISGALKEAGIEKKVVYGVDSELDTNPQIPLEFNNTKTIDKKNDLVNLCSRYCQLEDSFHDGSEPILHGGNRTVYRALEDVFETLKSGERPESPLVIHGENGLGKTYALKNLLHKAKENGILAVAHSVDDFVTYLTPSKGGLSHSAEDPEWYVLARDHAQLVVLDQVHSLVGKTRSGIDQRVGTQKRIFNLVEAVKKRGGTVVFSCTDTKKLDLEDLVDSMKSEDADRWGNIGNRDFGDRLGNYDAVEIGHIPNEEYSEVLREIAGGNGALINESVSSEQIVAAFVAADYGTKSTFRRTDANVRKVIRMSSLHNEAISPEFIVKNVGTKRARDKLAVGGFDFSKESYDRGSFLDDYSIDDIAEVILMHNVLKKIDLDLKDSEIIRRVEARWLSKGGNENPKADKILRLNDGNSSVVEYKAMEKLFDGYRKYRSRLF